MQNMYSFYKFAIILFIILKKNDILIVCFLRSSLKIFSILMFPILHTIQLQIAVISWGQYYAIIYFNNVRS